MNLPDKWIACGFARKMDLQEKWICLKNGFARKMDPKWICKKDGPKVDLPENGWKMDLA